MFTIEDQQDFIHVKYEDGEYPNTFGEELPGWNDSQDREVRARELYFRMCGYLATMSPSDLEDVNRLEGVSKTHIKYWERDFAAWYSRIPKILFNNFVSSLESMSKDYESVYPGAHEAITGIALYKCDSYSDVMALLMHYRVAGSDSSWFPKIIEVNHELWLKQSKTGTFVKKIPFVVIALRMADRDVLLTGVTPDANTIIRLIMSADLAQRRGVGLMPFPKGVQDYTDMLSGTVMEFRSAFHIGNKRNRGFDHEDDEDTEAQSWLGNLAKLKTGIDKLFKAMSEFGPRPLVKAFIDNNFTGKLTPYEQKQKKESDQWFHMLQVGKAGQADNEPQNAPKEQGDT